MKLYALVAVGGAVGAVLRFWLGTWAARVAPPTSTSGPLPFGSLPLGTLLVNVFGCLAIGILLMLADRQVVGHDLRVGLGVGLLGALTTFSTFGHETLDLVRRGLPGLALGNVALNLILGLGAVALGWWIGSRL